MTCDYPQSHKRSRISGSLGTQFCPRNCNVSQIDHAVLMEIERWVDNSISRSAENLSAAKTPTAFRFLVLSVGKKTSIDKMTVQSERNILTSHRWNELLINLEWAADKSAIK